MMLFFDTILFFDSIGISPFFVEDGVNRITTSFFLIVCSKTIQPFDIVSIIHCPGVNQFRSCYLIVCLDCESQSGD